MCSRPWRRVRCKVYVGPVAGSVHVQELDGQGVASILNPKS